VVFVGSSRAHHEGRILDRLRANLRAAGIPVTEEDVERLEADGYVERVVDTREILGAAELGGTPDFLRSWDPPVGGEPGRSGAVSADVSQEVRDSSAGHRPSVPGAEGHGDGESSPRTIGEAARMLREGRVSSVGLTERELARIAERDPVLNLFQVVLADRAMEAARRADERFRRGEDLGPLQGIPIAAKDLLDILGTVTTAGSKVRAGAASEVDASAIERLDRAGAVVVGKTRLSEFAYWPGSTNPHYGSTRNPRDTEHDAGGSSSGSAAAVADDCVFGALGTDTGGSIRIPAALCGVVGHKPTFGRVSLFGCVPLAWSLDHLGPITRTVEDAALMLEALAGHDRRDPRTRPGTDFSADAARAPDDLRGVRIGVMTRDGGGTELGTPEAVEAWHASNRALEAQGATLVEVDLSTMHVLWRISALTLAVEAAAYHAPGLRAHYDDFGRFCRGRLVGAFAYGFDDLFRAQRVLRRLRTEWDGLLASVDLISTPCQPDVAPALGVAASTRYTNPFNVLGWPAVTLPFGRGRGGLPLGTQLAGRPWDDEGVLRAAAALERSRNA